MRNQFKIIRSLSFFFIAFLFPVITFSQDISGVWVGHIYNDTTRKNIHYELAINESDGKASGYSHTTFVFDSVATIGVKSVKIKIKKDRIEVVDDRFIYDNFPTPPPQGVKMYSFLTLSENDTAKVLSGTWMTNSTKIYNAITGTIFLEKKNRKPDQTVIVTKLIQLGLGDKLSFLPPAIVSRDMMAMNAKTKSSQNPVSENKPVPASVNDEPGKKPLEATNENQKPNVAKAEQTNEIVVSENRKNNKPEEPLDVVKNEPVPVQGKSENPVKKEEVAQKQTDTKKPPVVPAMQQKVIAKNEPAREDQQQKNAVPPKAEILNQKELAVKESKGKNQRQDQVVPAENLQQPIVQQKKENISKTEDLNKNQLAGDQSGKKVEANLPTESKKQQPESVTVKQQIIPKIINENKQEVATGNENNSSGPPPAAEISKREIETIRTVDIASKDSLQFSLYDNGTVDGDTVTVLINGKVIMPRVGLLARAINKTIYLTPDMGDSISVVMYAENLGSIPPNTGLLVIRDEKRIYEIRFSGDLKKNSAIVLVRKKEE